jgi:hypothetical protein
MADPHRTGCVWNRLITPSGQWQSDLDWAVYHADGWGRWQRFRAGLVGSDIPSRVKLLKEWYEVDPSAANLIRVLNMCRALRGQWVRFPQIVTLHDRLNEIYNSKFL